MLSTSWAARGAPGGARMPLERQPEAHGPVRRRVCRMVANGCKWLQMVANGCKWLHGCGHARHAPPRASAAGPAPHARGPTVSTASLTTPTCGIRATTLGDACYRACAPRVRPFITGRPAVRVLLPSPGRVYLQMRSRAHRPLRLSGLDNWWVCHWPGVAFAGDLKCIAEAQQGNDGRSAKGNPGLSS
jgi:hypothetical protein